MVTAIGRISLALQRGQQKKQDIAAPATGATASDVAASASTGSAPAPAPPPASSLDNAVLADANWTPAPPVAAAPTTSPAKAARSAGPEPRTPVAAADAEVAITPMAARLSDLFAKLHNPLIAENELHRFVRNFDLEIVTLPAKGDVSQVQRVKRDMIAAAAATLVAQATLDRQSVLALLADRAPSTEAMNTV